MLFIAHMSYGYRPQLFSLAWQRPNLYTDISAWQTIAAHNYDNFARTMRQAVNTLGPERVLFGTDSHYFWSLMSEQDYVQAVKVLTFKVPEDAWFTDQEVDMILA